MKNSSFFIQISLFLGFLLSGCGSDSTDDSSSKIVILKAGDSIECLQTKSFTLTPSVKTDVTFEKDVTSNKIKISVNRDSKGSLEITECVEP